MKKAATFTPPVEDRFTLILHKRYGRIDAPPGYYFGPNETGKVVYLYSDGAEEQGRWLFPFGTEWRSTSIVAEAS
jgi:hypothetical protein